MKKFFEEKIAALREQRATLSASVIKEADETTRSATMSAINTIDEEIRSFEEQLAKLDAPASVQPEGRLDPVSAMNAEQRTDAPASDWEERAKAFATSGKLTVKAEEARSTLIGTSTLAKPTGVGGINSDGTVSSLVDLVTVEDMTGMGAYKEAYVKAWQTAGALTDGTAPDGSDPTFRTVAINPFLVGVVSYVSREIRKQTPLAYAEKVREGALIAIRNKLNNWAITGDGTNAIYGIYNAVNTDSEAVVTSLDLTGNIDEKTLRKIVFAYGGNEEVGGNARLFLKKADLIAFGDVHGTNEKKAVYEITPDASNPNTGIIRDGGLAVPYVICDACTGYAAATGTSAGVKTMVYGDPANYKLGLFGDIEVNASEDYKFAEGLITIRGEAMVGGNVVKDGGFVIVTKKNA